VNATVAKNQTFWFDRIEYIPSTSLSLSNKTIMVTSPDPAMQFATGWNDYAEIGNWTQTPGSVFAMNFYGMRIELICLFAYVDVVLQELHSAGMATYLPNGAEIRQRLHGRSTIMQLKFLS
jgi:hypothetical protein